MARGNHRSRQSIANHIAHIASRRLDHRNDYDSIVKPPLKVKSAMAHRWTDTTQALEIPKPRTPKPKTKSKYAWRRSTYPRLKLIA